MAYVSSVIDRVAGAGRRVTGGPEWPLAAGALLGLYAAVEAVLRVEGSSPDLSIALLLALCGTAPLALARTQVLAAAVTITAAVVLMLLLYGRPPAPALVGQVAVLYLLGRHGPRWASALLVVPFVGYAVASLFGESGPAPVVDGTVAGGGATMTGGGPFAVLLAFLAAAAVGIGWARRVRSEAVQRDVSRRAIADTLLEHAARGERARIARELHDVVAHHISMIAVQAETARLTTPGLPADGAKRLLAIGDTARTALTEMRRLLGVLREDAAPEPGRRPQPGLEQLNELIDEMRESAGTSARLIVSGPVVPLDAGVQLTAYRIVQEALSNARRHAAGAAVDVELRYAGDALRIRVRDNGPGPPDGTPPGGAPPDGPPLRGAPAAGHGLLGMRERAGMVGGTLRVGPAPAGGFLVEAALPAPRGEEE